VEVFPWQFVTVIIGIIFSISISIMMVSVELLRLLPVAEVVVIFIMLEDKAFVCSSQLLVRLLVE